MQLHVQRLQKSGSVAIKLWIYSNFCRFSFVVKWRNNVEVLFSLYCTIDAACIKVLHANINPEAPTLPPFFNFFLVTTLQIATHNCLAIILLLSAVMGNLLYPLFQDRSAFIPEHGQWVLQLVAVPVGEISRLSLLLAELRIPLHWQCCVCTCFYI